MSNDQLASYLQDHLAGSVGAVEMLKAMSAAAPEEQKVGQFCRRLLKQVEADQGELQAMIDALGISEGVVRKAGAWVAEKVIRAKLSWEGEGGVVQGLEALVLGITGKKLLWQALTVVQPEWAPLRRFDFARLERRAAKQLRDTNRHRLQAARKAFGKAGTKQ